MKHLSTTRYLSEWRGQLKLLCKFVGYRYVGFDCGARRAGPE